MGDNVTAADNQQERLAQLGYLAGIIDGEGWIGLTRHTNPENRAGFSLIPQISIHMVGKDGIEYVHGLFEQLGLPSYFIHLKESSRWSIRGFKRVVPVLETLMPYLHIKQRQALLVIECSLERQRRSHHSDPGSRELELLEEIRSLNVKGKNPQRLYA